MHTWSNPVFPQFDLDKATLDNFYKYLYGRDLSGAILAPPFRAMTQAERRVWREVAYALHICKSLKAAVLSVQNNYLFWAREVIDPAKQQLLSLGGQQNPRQGDWPAQYTGWTCC